MGEQKLKSEIEFKIVPLTDVTPKPHNYSSRIVNLNATLYKCWHITYA